MINEDLGYIKAKLDNISDRLDKLDYEQKEFSDKLHKTSEQLALYRHMFNFMRVSGACVILIITLKFGSIPAFFGGGS